MKLNRKDLKIVGKFDISDTDIPKNKLSIDDLKSLSTKIDINRYIDNNLSDVSDCYICDLETYFYNSKVRMIQLYETKNKIIHVFIDGSVKDKDKVINNKTLKDYKIEFHLFDSEEKMFIDFIELIKNNPKTIIGHNFAHFDIGIIGSLIQEFKIKGFHIFEYSVGSNKGERRVAFSYCINNDKSVRYNIIDTLMIAQSLQLESISLKELSKNTKFEKKEIDFRVYENNILESDSVLYGIYDVISIPDVLKNLIKMWDVALKELKINYMHSQRCPEHVLMKGCGSIAESYLNNLFDGNISLNCKDYLTKYFGGITRAWNNDLVVADKNNKIRYLDFTSYYPFSVRKQKIFDILNGDCERVLNTDFELVKDKYDDFIYSSVFEIKAKEGVKVIIEGELKKEDSDFFGVGFFRSFDKTKRIADLEHQFIFVYMKKGDSIKITKTEFEITKSLIPDIEDKVVIERVINGMYATSDKKSEEYIKLFSERKKLKKEKNEANVGYKVLLNASYGKIAESRGKWFNLACASAITGYCRANLMKIIFHSKKNKLDVLYSDTDSLYVKGSENNIQKVIEYSNSLNEFPKLFGEDNLKDEGEDIVCFWGIKRKRYLKVINNNGKNHVIVKGENGSQDIGWRDIYFRVSCICNGCLDIDEIENKIQTCDFNLKPPESSEFESACKKLYHNHKNKKMSDLISVKSNGKINMMLRVHFKKSTTYEGGMYYKKIVEGWEKKTNRKAWIGCFFDINRDYTFNEKQADDFSNWAIQYESYYSEKDFIPIIWANQYNELVNQKINLDTFRIKTREGINLNNFESIDDKLAVTNKIFSLSKTTQSNKVIDIFGLCLIFRLRIPENLNINEVEILTNTDEDKKKYSNATLFLTPKFNIESALRINKSRMFIPERDIFSIYRFVSDLGIFAQRLVINMLNKVTSTKKGGTIQPLELNTFPRFTFITQADVYQPVTKEYARKIHNACFDSEFHNASINHFWNFKLLSYCELNVYDKYNSAKKKIDKFKDGMQNFEKETFEYEMKEGEYRSEIKFKLKRNYYETLSYIFSLGNMNQEYFLNIIEKNDKKFKSVRKYYEFNIPAKLKGYFEFNQNKCVILFHVYNKLNDDSLFKLQVYMPECEYENSSFLVGRGILTHVTPPNKIESYENNEKSIVRWMWEKDKMVKKDDIEDSELENMGFK